MIEIYHNPRCGKSRACLLYVEESGKEFQTIKYLENPPSVAELTDIIRKLHIRPIALVRQKEKIWIDTFKNKVLSDAEIIQAMASNPILIERPIVINGEKAVIARPFDKANDII